MNQAQLGPNTVHPALAGNDATMVFATIHLDPSESQSGSKFSVGSMEFTISEFARCACLRWTHPTFHVYLLLT